MRRVLRPCRSYVEISRAAIASNYRAVRDLVGPAGVIGVVKADAYGHGALEVARVLEREGIQWLAVSSVEEGVALRGAGIGTRILVMAGVMAWERGAVREYRLTPVLHSLRELRDFAGMNVHLKLDTGMSRLGTAACAGEIAEALRDAPSTRLEGLLSHFASAADLSGGQTPEQIRQFHALVKSLQELGIRPRLLHFSSSNAVAYPRRDAWLSLVRPGHAIYGYLSPAVEAPALQVRPALSWYARIIETKEIAAGTKVGYGGTYVARQPMKIAVIAAGYADGIPHRLSNRGKVIAGGKFAPMIGTVSMDLTTIDITASPHLCPGDVVTLLGSEGGVSLDAQQIARLAGTISYTVLTGIRSRVKRYYTD